MNNRERLTILVGAGAVIDASKDCDKLVDTNSITEDILNDSSNKNVHELLNTIYDDLFKHYKRYNQRPNFEDLFHALEVLKSIFTIENAAPEYIPMYKFFMSVKDKYQKFDPYKLNPIEHSISAAQSCIIKIIQDCIESYSNKSPVVWYRYFFKKLLENYNLDIFSLNYDTWFEQIYDEYNDGFIDTNSKSQFLQFKPNKVLDSNHPVNIHHMHGQIDFRPIDTQENAEEMFDDYQLNKIYKIKNVNKTKRKLDSVCSDNTTQAGEHLKNCPIITGKMKIEKTIFPPLDAYRTNLNNCIVKNPNLLIIGYGFADYYIDNLLGQFHNIHGDKKRVNIIDYADSQTWKMQYTPFGLFGHKFHTLFGLCGDFGIEPSKLRQYKEIIELDNTHFHIYLKGFKKTVKENLNDIINSYR